MSINPCKPDSNQLATSFISFVIAICVIMAFVSLIRPSPKPTLAQIEALVYTCAEYGRVCGHEGMTSEQLHAVIEQAFKEDGEKLLKLRKARAR